MPAQWPRALIRAALREAGYDAVGTQSLGTSLRIPADEPQRGPVRVVIVDQPALAAAEADTQLAALLARHRGAATLLVAQAIVAPSKRTWPRVIRRPVSVADIAQAVQSLLPLAAAQRHSID